MHERIVPVALHDHLLIPQLLRHVLFVAAQLQKRQRATHIGNENEEEKSINTVYEGYNTRARGVGEHHNKKHAHTAIPNTIANKDKPRKTNT